MSNAHLSRCYVANINLAASLVNILKPHWVSLILLFRTNFTSKFIPQARNFLKGDLSASAPSSFLDPIAHDNPFLIFYLHPTKTFSRELISVAPSASANITISPRAKRLPYLTAAPFP
jgi:hypothetical protein